MDMELKKALFFLLIHMVETSQKLKLADIQIETYKRSMTHAQLTEKEVSQLPLEVNTYESLGRMFVMKESTETRKNLENKIKVCEDKIKTLEGSKTYLERSLKESENNIREMVQQRKFATVDENH
uniref:EOG090X0LK7 n=1 Tax=Evadne anonyx TaxID=141404 RepID=A0A9N6WQS9_9CRUS|nr:EOG090X0LK7 [Evadne anonyx]